MVKIEFTKEWSIYKKGDVGEFSNELASSIIRQRKVAKLFKPKAKKKA